MNSEIDVYIIPGKKFGSYFFCPIHAFEPEKGEPTEFSLLPEIEKMLAPTEARHTIARIHANNILQYAREILKTNELYIHGTSKYNYVLYLVSKQLTEAQAYKKMTEIELNPEKYKSNDVFVEKVQNS